MSCLSNNKVYSELLSSRIFPPQISQMYLCNILRKYKHNNYICIKLHSLTMFLLRSLDISIITYINMETKDQRIIVQYLSIKYCKRLYSQRKKKNKVNNITNVNNVRYCLRDIIHTMQICQSWIMLRKENLQQFAWQNDNKSRWRRRRLYSLPSPWTVNGI